MPCSSNHNNLYKSIGKLVTITTLAVSSFVIACAFCSSKEYSLQNRLRQSYDGLSPRDYQE